MRETYGILSFCLLTSLLGCSDGSTELDDPTKHFIAAQDAIANGDTEAAIRELTLSIEGQPDTWAYLQRGKLYAEQGKDDEAMADCNAGLEIDPESIQLQWLSREIKKPRDNRFVGKNAQPPVNK